MDRPVKAPDGSGTWNAGYRVVHIEGRGQVRAHRLAMEALLGRPLMRFETVHHVNGDRADNTTNGPLINFRSGNLELWNKQQPAGQRVEDKIAYAVSLLELYKPELLQHCVGCRCFEAPRVRYNSS
jgi:hypothetical protein